jgi:hypothetical protein
MPQLTYHLAAVGTAQTNPAEAPISPAADASYIRQEQELQPADHLVWNLYERIRLPL